MHEDCPFCVLDRKPIKETPYMLLIESKFPVNEKAYYLIIPKRHIESCYDLSIYEWLESKELILHAKLLCYNGHCFDSNVGWNDGELAGQTIMHAHIHVMGRKKGDVKDPRGGIRNIIPRKGNYLRTTKQKPNNSERLKGET